jgi:hypothetical protein
MEIVRQRVQESTRVLGMDGSDCLSSACDAFSRRGDGNGSLESVVNLVSQEEQERLPVENKAKIEEPGPDVSYVFQELR